MQLINLLCSILLMINLAATRIHSESQQHELLQNHMVRRFSKREAAVLIDNFPIEPGSDKKEKIFYRRVSKQRFRGPRGPKSKYGPPINHGTPDSKQGPPSPKYGLPPPKYSQPRVKFPLKPGRNFLKKYKGKNSSKHGYRAPPRNKKRSPKPKFRPPKHTRPKPTYGPPKKVIYQPYPHEPMGFGEPPSDLIHGNESPRPTSGEPPVDSYGAPLQPTHDDVYPTAHGIYETTSAYESPYRNFGQEYQPSWQTELPHQVVDNSYAHSNKVPTYEQPLGNVFSDAIDYNEDFNLDPYADLKKLTHHNKKNSQSKKVMQFFNNKLVNKPWKINDNKDPDDQMLVGGQYAEPPARYVPKFQPSAPMYLGNEEFRPPNSIVDLEVLPSAAVSSYVNYKNSNLAFSPQNLNDAFSIVD